VDVDQDPHPSEVFAKPNHAPTRRFNVFGVQTNGFDPTAFSNIDRTLVVELLGDNR